MLFINKAVSKDITPRTRTWNNFPKDRRKENKKKYLKQPHFCVSLLRKHKLDYLEHLDEKMLEKSDLSI